MIANNVALPQHAAGERAEGEIHHGLCDEADAEKHMVHPSMPDRDIPSMPDACIEDIAGLEPLLNYLVSKGRPHSPVSVLSSKDCNAIAAQVTDSISSLLVNVVEKIMLVQLKSLTDKMLKQISESLDNDRRQATRPTLGKANTNSNLSVSTLSTSDNERHPSARPAFGGNTSTSNLITPNDVGANLSQSLGAAYPETTFGHRSSNGRIRSFKGAVLKTLSLRRRNSEDSSNDTSPKGCKSPRRKSKNSRSEDTLSELSQPGPTMDMKQLEDNIGDLLFMDHCLDGNMGGQHRRSIDRQRSAESLTSGAGSAWSASASEGKIANFGVSLSDGLQIQSRANDCRHQGATQLPALTPAFGKQEEPNLELTDPCCGIRLPVGAVAAGKQFEVASCAPDTPEILAPQTGSLEEKSPEAAHVAVFVDANAISRDKNKDTEGTGSRISTQSTQMVRVGSASTPCYSEAESADDRSEQEVAQECTGPCARWSIILPCGSGPSFDNDKENTGSCSAATEVSRVKSLSSRPSLQIPGLAHSSSCVSSRSGSRCSSGNANLENLRRIRTQDLVSQLEQNFDSVKVEGSQQEDIQSSESEDIMMSGNVLSTNAHGHLQYSSVYLSRIAGDYVLKCLAVVPWCAARANSTSVVQISYTASRWYQCFVVLLTIITCVWSVTMTLPPDVVNRALGAGVTSFLPWMLSDLPLAIGGFTGLLLLGTIRGSTHLVGVLNLLSSYTSRMVVFDNWLDVSKKDFFLSMAIWLITLLARSFIMYELDESRVIYLLRVGVFGVNSALLLGLGFCIIHICRALTVMVDKFCADIADTRKRIEISQAAREWNVLQAVLRKASGSVEYCFFAMQAVVFSIVLLNVVDAIISISRSGKHCLNHLIPVNLVAMALVRVFFCAAAVTDKCTRVPSLINSLGHAVDSSEHDFERQYLVEYIVNSAAGFYVFEVRLTQGMALKFTYVCLLVFFWLITNVILKND